MATNSKRIKVNPDILVEYVYDSTNYVTEDYKIINNIKEKTKSFLSTTNLNSYENNLFLVDPLLSKYSPLDTNNFNFLKIQNYSSSYMLYDKVIIYLPSGYDFDDYLGFYLNIFTHGYDNNTKYSFANFFYTKDNPSTIKIYDLPKPFLYDEKFWVRAIEVQIPAPNFVSQQRLITNTINEPKANSINKNLTYGEGISVNSPIFIDFSFIVSSQLTLNVPYYFINTTASFTIPMSPEYTELGMEVVESTQGDYFELYASYMGSNENMDEFIYSEQIKGNVIQLEYVVMLFEENILTTTQTYIVTNNFTKKILYRPVIQFSNTTASIDVELKIINLVDNSYISKFGSLGLTKNLNKYGIKLSKLNISSNVISPEIYNVKYSNVMSVTVGVSDGTIDIMRVPYPLLIDKYKILSKSNNSTNTDSGYVPNGMLEIIITSFDTVINFIIAEDIGTDGNAVPYNLSKLANNSKIILTFKSDSEKVEKDIYTDPDNNPDKPSNNYTIGNIYYKIEENDYNIIKKIYDKGYNNFYIVVKSDAGSTQLYSGKYIFYEDISFVQPVVSTALSTEISTEVSVSTSVSVAPVVQIITDQTTNYNKKTTLDVYDATTQENVNYYNLLVYVRYEENIKLFDSYINVTNLNAQLKIKYANIYLFERLHGSIIVEIEKLAYLEQVFRLPLGMGQLPVNIATTTDTQQTTNIYKDKEGVSTTFKKPTEEIIKVIPIIPDVKNPNTAIDKIEKTIKTKEPEDESIKKKRIKPPKSEE